MAEGQTSTHDIRTDGRWNGDTQPRLFITVHEPPHSSWRQRVLHIGPGPKESPDAGRLHLVVEISRPSSSTLAPTKSCGLMLDVGDVVALRDLCNEWLGHPTDEDFEALRQELANKYET